MFITLVYIDQITILRINEQIKSKIRDGCVVHTELFTFRLCYNYNDCDSAECSILSRVDLYLFLSIYYYISRVMQLIFSDNIEL